jgi:NTE family protein
VSGSYRSLVTAPISVASNTAFRFRLGGFGNLSGFQKDSIVGESTFRAAINAYRRVASPTVFSWEFPVYVGGIFELGSAWNGDRDSIPAAVDPLLWSTMVFAGVVTPLGPLYVAYAYGEGGSNQGYLFLGQAF